MSQYYDVLKDLAESNEDERMSCSRLDQIQQWYSVVLNHSYTKIRIFCKDLDWLNNQLLLDALHNFLYAPWAHIQILLKEDCDLSWFHFKNNGGNLEIKTAVGSYATPEAKEFTVADDHCYRFEVSPDFGLINFNNHDDAFNLINAFDKAFLMGVVKEFRKTKKVI